jgi:hypothetical protein
MGRCGKGKAAIVCARRAVARSQLRHVPALEDMLIRSGDLKV